MNDPFFPLRLRTQPHDRGWASDPMDLLRLGENSVPQASGANAPPSELSTGSRVHCNNVHCTGAEDFSSAPQAAPAEHERSKLSHAEPLPTGTTPQHPLERKRCFPLALKWGKHCPATVGERTAYPVSARPQPTKPVWRFALAVSGSPQKSWSGNRAQAAPRIPLHSFSQKRTWISKLSLTQRRETGGFPYTFAFTLTGNSHEARDAHQRGPTGRMPDCHC